MTGAMYLTFDDRTVMQWHAQADLFAQHGARVTFFVSHPDLLSADEAALLVDLAARGHAVGAHGLRHLDAPAYLEEHSEAEYLATEIDPCCDALSALGTPVRHFAYPYGRRTERTDEFLLKRFSWIRATSPRAAGPDEMRFRPEDPSCSRSLPARGIDVGHRGAHLPDQQDALDELMRAAADEGASLCLYAHGLLDDPAGLASGRLYVTPELLDHVLSLANALNLPCRSFADLPE
jgi:hypothetical protein